MRLLYVRGPELTFRSFPPSAIPKYAIASHRWTEEEAMLEDFQQKKNTGSLGYKKVEGFAKCVRDNFPGIDYLWYDSCCIRQTSDREVSEAINSMYRWYQKTEICLAYLADVEEPGDEDAFRKSVWHTRGWTLQELVAPSCVLFLSKSWEVVGHKGRASGDDELADLELGPALEPIVSLATGISENVLRDREVLNQCSTDEKLEWVQRRMTTYPEDMTYCLMGFFGVTMPVIYGEGHERARQRLLAEIGHGKMLPTQNIPHNRDPDYVGRQELLNRINDEIAVPAARVALVGLGGVGKTQLLIDYAYRTRMQSPVTSLIWIHASNATRFQESVREFADCVNIPGRDSPNADLFQLFRTWLCDRSHAPWLILMDNLDDSRVLFEQPSGGEQALRLIDYLPVCEHGRILITSRSIDDALQIVPNTSAIRVHPMNREQANELLVKKLGQITTTKDSLQLAEALDHLPLAISQASAYIQRLSPHLSVKDYLRQLESSRETRTRLFEQEPTIYNRDRDANNSIMVTWQVSSEHLQRKKKSAADLLAVMSFCDRQAMPECLLREGYVWDDEGHHIARSKDNEFQQFDNDTFEDDIVTLRDFAFVTATTNTSFWSMHRLVQDSTRHWLSEKGQLNRPLSSFLRRLEAVLPYGRFENWETCQMLRPHVRSAAEAKPYDRNPLLSWASIMHKASYFSFQMGTYAEAESLSRRAMNVRSRILGNANDLTLNSMDFTARALAENGKLSEAESLIQTVNEVCRQMHGENFTANSDYSITLSKVLWRQGRYMEQEQILSRILGQLRKTLGSKHRSTLVTMGDLASNLECQGRLTEAEELYLEVTEWSRKLYGENHPETLTNSSNLACIYIGQERYGEAERIYIDSLNTRKAVQGETHPDTLVSMNNLAIVYRTQGRLREAEELHARVLEKRLELFGADYTHTLMSKCNLAAVWNAQGNLVNAEKAFVETVEGCRKVLGGEHPVSLHVMHKLAHTYYCQGKFDESEELFAKTLEGEAKVLGLEHGDTQSSKKWLERVRREIRPREEWKQEQGLAGVEDRPKECYRSSVEVSSGEGESHLVRIASPVSTDHPGNASSQVPEVFHGQEEAGLVASLGYGIGGLWQRVESMSCL